MLLSTGLLSEWKIRTLCSTLWSFDMLQLMKSAIVKCPVVFVGLEFYFAFFFSLSFRGSQEQQAQPRPQDSASQSWYPPSVVSSPGSSRPSTPSSTSSGSFNYFSQSTPHVSPTEASGIINHLKDKRYFLFQASLEYVCLPFFFWILVESHPWFLIDETLKLGSNLSGTLGIWLALGTRILFWLLHLMKRH